METRVMDGQREAPPTSQMAHLLAKFRTDPKNRVGSTCAKSFAPIWFAPGILRQHVCANWFAPTIFAPTMFAPIRFAPKILRLCSLRQNFCANTICANNVCTSKICAKKFWAKFFVPTHLATPPTHKHLAQNFWRNGHWRKICRKSYWCKVISAKVLGKCFSAKISAQWYRPEKQGVSQKGLP